MGPWAAGAARIAQNDARNTDERERVAEVKTWHTVHYLAVLIIRPPNRFLFFAAAQHREFFIHSLAHLSAAPRAEDDERAFC
jgi:hypothetical protein